MSGASQFAFLAAVLCAAQTFGQETARASDPVPAAIVSVARSQLDAVTNAELTDELIRNESAALKRFERPLQFIYLGKEQALYATGYVFGISFRNGRIIEHIAFDPSGKIAGIDFQTFVRR